MTSWGNRTRVTIGVCFVVAGVCAFSTHMMAMRLSAANQQIIDLRAQVSELQSHLAQSSPAQSSPMQPVTVDRSAQPRMRGEFDGANDTNAGAQVYLNHGTKKFMARDYAGAESDYRYAVRLDPYSSDALAALGISQELRGEIADAESSYTKALQLHNNLQALNGLANIRYHQHRFQEAHHLVETVLAQDPYNRSGVWLMALVLDALHQPDAALPMYERFLEIDPNSNAAIYAREKLKKANAGAPTTH